MHLSLLLLQFFNDILHQKLRAFLTVFGLTWGTTAIMLMLAIGEANRREMVSHLQAIGEDIVSLWPGRTSKPFRGMPQYRQLRFDMNDVAALAALPDVEAAGGELRLGRLEVRYGTRENAFSVSGVCPSWALLRNVIAEEGGRDVNQRDMEETRRVVVMGGAVKEELFGEEDAIGQFIQIGNAPYRVIGITEPRDAGGFFRERSSDTLFIPLSTALRLSEGPYITGIVYKPAQVRERKRILSTVISFFARLKSFDPDDVHALHVWDMSDSAVFITDFTFGLQLFMGIVGIFTLTVAAIGVTNIMHVIVEERTKEIGIKMALGVTRRAVMSQFIFESFMFALIGGVGGFLISYGLCALIRMMEVEGMGEPSVTVTVATMTTLILGLAAFLAGIFPARRAARMQPVEALRWG